MLTFDVMALFVDFGALNLSSNEELISFDEGIDTFRLELCLLLFPFDSSPRSSSFKNIFPCFFFILLIVLDLSSVLCASSLNILGKLLLSEPLRYMN